MSHNAFFFLSFETTQFHNTGPCPLPVSALMWSETGTETTVSMQFWRHLSFCYEEEPESLLLSAKQK